MTPFKLAYSRAAKATLVRRGKFLISHRGPDFAAKWSDGFISWLENLAASGAVIGTKHLTNPAFRTFPFRGEATLLVEYTPNEMIIIQIYFAGQDWLA